MSMLSDAKTALQISGTSYDAEITNYIAECKVDIQAAGITSVDENDSAIHQLIILFCKMRFELFHGNPELSIAVKEVYDEQKAQYGMRTGYTDFGETEEDEDEEDS